MAFDLATVMDGLAAATGMTNAYGYPAPVVTVPCVVVGYPTKLDYDLTFHVLATDGKIEAIFPVWYVVNAALDLAARDALNIYVTGAAGIKQKLDGSVAGYDIVNTVDCTVEKVTIGAIEYMAVRFDVMVVG